MLVGCRVEVDRASRIVYVADTGQAGHFDACFAAARAAGLDRRPDLDLEHQHVQLEHVGFGLVFSGSGSRLRSRQIAPDPDGKPMDGAVPADHSLQGWMAAMNAAAAAAGESRRRGGVVPADPTAAAAAAIRYGELRRRREK